MGAGMANKEEEPGECTRLLRSKENVAQFADNRGSYIFFTLTA